MFWACRLEALGTCGRFLSALQLTMPSCNAERMIQTDRPRPQAPRKSKQPAQALQKTLTSFKAHRDADLKASFRFRHR